MEPSQRIVVEVRYAEGLMRSGIEAALLSQADLQLQRHPVLPGDTAAMARPGVVVADHQQGMSSARTAQVHPGGHAPVLLVTEQSTATAIRDALQGGVRGYLLSDCSIEQLAGAVRELAQGRLFLCERAQHLMMESLLHPTLTARERDVLHLMSCGLRDKGIAHQLGLAVGTVKALARGVLAKMSASTRTEAVSTAASRGLLPDVTHTSPHALR